MGLDIFLCDGEKQLGDVPSDKYPGHLFQKTYLKSSYNEAGFNSVVRNLTGIEGLYYIFQPPAGEYEIPYSKEDLAACRERALEVLEAVKCARPLRVLTVNYSVLAPRERYRSVDARRALEIANEELDRREREGLPGLQRLFAWYWTREGLFFQHDPPKLVAAVPGVGVLGEPAVHLVYEDDLTWYVQAAEIVVEFIDYAMTLDDPKLIWSA